MFHSKNGKKMDYILNSVKVILSGILLALALGNLIEIFSTDLKALTIIAVLSIWLIFGVRYIIVKHEVYEKYSD